MRFAAMALLAGCSLAGCTTGPARRNDRLPPNVAWSRLDLRTNTILKFPPTDPTKGYVLPFDDYVVVFRASSASGIKTISLSGTGEAFCAADAAPYPRSNPYLFSIPLTTIDLSELSGGQAYTEAFFPYYFSWPNGPAAAAWKRCGPKFPVLGTATFTGQATTFSGVSTSPASVFIGVCAAPGGCGP